jgi:hypothetical protein
MRRAARTADVCRTDLDRIDRLFLGRFASSRREQHAGSASSLTCRAIASSKWVTARCGRVRHYSSCRRLRPRGIVRRVRTGRLEAAGFFKLLRWLPFRRSGAPVLSIAADEIAAGVWIASIGACSGSARPGAARRTGDGRSARQWYAVQPALCRDTRVALRDNGAASVTLTRRRADGLALMDRLREAERMPHGLAKRRSRWRRGCCSGPPAVSTKPISSTALRPSSPKGLVVGLGVGVESPRRSSCCHLSSRPQSLGPCRYATSNGNAGRRTSRSSPAAAADSCGPLTLLASGALHPQHSLLAALGVTHRAFVATRESSCRRCDLDPCSFRRVPLAS